MNKITFDYSRIVCDVERFLKNEPMEKYGMGFCYMNGYNGRQIRKEGDEPYNSKKELKLYKEHHKKFSDICKENKKLFILDIHSYNEKIIPSDMIKKEKALPDICLGFDKKYMSDEIVSFAAKKFLEKGFSVGYNYPYSGSFVPKEVLVSPEKYDCLSLMVEVNRDVVEYGYYSPGIICSDGIIREILDDILLYSITHTQAE